MEDKVVYIILQLTENNRLSLVEDVQTLPTHHVLHLVTADCNIIYNCSTM